MSIDFWQAWNWVDYSIVGLIALSTIISVIRGFVREAFSLAVWVLAIIVAIKFAPTLAGLFTKHIESGALRLIISLAGLFLVTLVVGGLVNYLLGQLVTKTGLGGTDRLLGILFGVARGILLVALLVLLGDISAFSKDPWWVASKLIPHFQGLANWLNHFLGSQFGQLSDMLPNLTTPRVSP